MYHSDSSSPLAGGRPVHIAWQQTTIKVSNIIGPSSDILVVSYAYSYHPFKQVEKAGIADTSKCDSNGSIGNHNTLKAGL